MNFEYFMSRIKYSWIFQKIIYFPSHTFVIWKSKIEKLKMFIDNIISVKDAMVLC
jgi:hypothetical protein